MQNTSHFKRQKLVDLELKESEVHLYVSLYYYTMHNTIFTHSIVMYKIYWRNLRLSPVGSGTCRHIKINIKYLCIFMGNSTISSYTKSYTTQHPHTHTHTLRCGNPFLIFGQYTWPKWHLEFYYNAETSAITTTNWHHLQGLVRHERREDLGVEMEGGQGRGRCVCRFDKTIPFGAIEFLWKPHKFRGIFNSKEKSEKPFLPISHELSNMPTWLGQFIAFGQFVKCHSGEF